ncbi:MAG: glycosyltransferase family 1 protein [Patescibacteria group bacterium]|nr:glycosyltransferase family 1 protein [Patescibacteria group bacterium]MDD5294826.1 glycosyltransferase family 1 protein [Patescibacteria group bacterium]MDD5554181.1 glycosyltransferase family 1 protein [Patescibacteria group bacterium]
MRKNKGKIKRIGIDARFYGPIGKGLGRYTKEVVDRVVVLDKENEYIVFLSKENFDEFIPNNPKVKKVLADVHWYTLAEQIIMPYLIWQARLDLMHFPHFNVPILTPVKFVVTIHDLILTKFPTIRATTLSPLFYKLKNRIYRIVIWLAVRRARAVIAVSQFTKDDIARQFKIKPGKVVVTYEGVSGLLNKKLSDFSHDKETFLGYNIGSPFLLYVGNAYPHKNLEGLVKVFSVIHGKRPDLSLVLVGRQDYFYKRVEEFSRKYWDKESPVIFPGFVPDENLKILYSQALAYVFPSFYEGFGLPPLEAMACGCPVISSNKSSLPEILGQAAIYFNPEDEGEMIKQIEKIIEDKNLRQELVKKGYEQVKKYSWEKCAKETLGVYEKVFKN